MRSRSANRRIVLFTSARGDFFASWARNLEAQGITVIQRADEKDCLDTLRIESGSGRLYARMLRVEDRERIGVLVGEVFANWSRLERG